MTGHEAVPFADGHPRVGFDLPDPIGARLVARRFGAVRLSFG